MHSFLTDMLECPACHGQLTWTTIKHRESRIEEAETRCESCGANYPVREGIGLFLTPDLPRNDLWEQTGSHLKQYLEEHPVIEHRLMETPMGELNPADLLYRAIILDERGEYNEAKDAYDLAHPMLYTPEQRACGDSLVDHIVSRLSASEGPIVDLASGRCSLVEVLAHKLRRPIVATDFSPRVLRRDRRWLEFFGLYDRVSLLAFDARRTPFRDGAVGTMTCNEGLSNIQEPHNLFRELRRVVSGEFLAISSFYPEDDRINGDAIREAGLSETLYLRSVLDSFAASGWKVEVAKSCKAKACPTPCSVILEGAAIDSLPVAETTSESCGLIAR